MFRRGTAADARAAADLWLRARKAALRVIPQPVHSDDDLRALFASHVVCETELWWPRIRRARSPASSS